MENVLVADDLSIRLMDFGLSKLLDYSRMTKMTGAIGTSIYMAPELTLALAYNSSVDVFAFGILAFIVLSGNFHPYATNHENPVGTTPYRVEMRVAVDPQFRPDLKKSSIKAEWALELIEKCWEGEPEQRPTFRVILDMLKTQKKEVVEEGSEDSDGHFDARRESSLDEMFQPVIWGKKEDNGASEVDERKALLAWNEKLRSETNELEDVFEKATKRKEERRRVLNEKAEAIIAEIDALNSKLGSESSTGKSAIAVEEKEDGTGTT